MRKEQVPVTYHTPSRLYIILCIVYFIQQKSPFMVYEQ